MLTRLLRTLPCLAVLMFVGWFGCSSPAPSETLDSGADVGDQRCIVDTFVDNQCDVCENAHCCATRFTCYDDKACFYADRDLDKCLAAVASGDAGVDVGSGDGGDAADAGGDNAPPTVQSCWDTFAAADTIASDRVACQRANCKTECEVP